MRLTEIVRSDRQPAKKMRMSSGNVTTLKDEMNGTRSQSSSGGNEGIWRWTPVGERLVKGVGQSLNWTGRSRFFKQKCLCCRGCIEFPVAGVGGNSGKNNHISTVYTRTGISSVYVVCQILQTL